MLFAVVGFAFERVTTAVDAASVSDAFSKEFQHQITLTQEATQYWQKQFWDILEKGYNFRYEIDPQIDLKALIENEDLLRRFVEGFTLIY